MSLGYGACCRKAAEDDNMLIYEYSVYNWNLKGYEHVSNVYDGIIFIDKLYVTYGEETFLKNVCIENCSHAWQILQTGVDSMAICLAHRIFLEYQKQGVFVNGVGVGY